MALSKRTKINYVVDVVMGIAFLLVAITGLIKFPGLLGLFGINFGQLPLGTISFIHGWSGIIMALTVLLHLLFHWGWIKAITGQITKKTATKA